MSKNSGPKVYEIITLSVLLLMALSALFYTTILEEPYNIGGGTYKVPYFKYEEFIKDKKIISVTPVRRGVMSGYYVTVDNN